MNNCSPDNSVAGTYEKAKSAWLLTWEWDGDHAAMKDKFVALLTWQYSSGNVAKIVERYFVSAYLSLFEQVRYTESKADCPYHVSFDTIPVADSIQHARSIPSQGPFSESMRIGANPCLWGRKVHELEAWVAEDGIENLKWKERTNVVLDDSGVRADWVEKHLTRQR